MAHLENMQILGTHSFTVNLSCMVKTKLRKVFLLITPAKRSACTEFIEHNSDVSTLVPN